MSTRTAGLGLFESLLRIHLTQDIGRIESHLISPLAVPTINFMSEQDFMILC